MSIAQASYVMRLSEAITIYLAAGAPFGAYNLLRERTSRSRFHTFLKATRAAIFWPLAAAKILFPLKSQGMGKQASKAVWENEEFFEKITQAQRQQLASLQSLIRLTQELSGAERSNAEHAFYRVREIVERYVGLTLAAAGSDSQARPSEREMELCRISGRSGEDLSLAGLCVHRRNTARLITHQARARTELLHALAEIRELAGISTPSLNEKAARHLSVALVRFYSYAFNLLSLLEDETAAGGVARLLDAECWRLRRLEAHNLKETQATEEEICRTHGPHPIFIAQSQLEASNHQG